MKTKIGEIEVKLREMFPDAEIRVTDVLSKRPDEAQYRTRTTCLVTSPAGTGICRQVVEGTDPDDVLNHIEQHPDIVRANVERWKEPL